jgi:hypothetical protein
MLTVDGLLDALESIASRPMECRLFTNEPDGDVLYASDLEEPQHYKPVTVEPSRWKIDAENLSMTADRLEFSFSGKAGKIAGYFLSRNGRVLNYELFMDPVPINSVEDKIGVRPRILAKRVTVTE